MKTPIKFYTPDGSSVLHFFLSGLLFLVISGNVYAQSGFKTTPSIAASFAKTNEKIIRSFNRSFSDAKDPVWSVAGDKHLVTFRLDEVKHHALYNSNGRRLYNIMYAGAKQLPRTVIARIKYSYPDYSII